MDGRSSQVTSSGRLLEPHRADLTGAWLDRADLIKANLSGANLSGADLGTARDLAQEQLDGAIGDSRTKLPASLRRPESWSESEGLQPG